jgi:hypothetical protein
MLGLTSGDPPSDNGDFCRLSRTGVLRNPHTTLLKPFIFSCLVVEAGGVEPPSEKARNEETTCVAGSKFSAAASEPARAAAT